MILWAFLCHGGLGESYDSHDLHAGVQKMSTQDVFSGKFSCASWVQETGREESA